MKSSWSCVAILCRCPAVIGKLVCRRHLLLLPDDLRQHARVTSGSRHFCSLGGDRDVARIVTALQFVLYRAEWPFQVLPAELFAAVELSFGPDVALMSLPPSAATSYASLIDFALEGL